MIEDQDNQSAQAELPALRWYIVQTYSGYENYVQKALQKRLEQKPELQAMVGQVLVPTEEVVEIRAGQKRKSERKFYPGYVFMQLMMSDKLWHFILDIPRVMCFVGGTSDRPAPITEEQADAIVNRMQEGVSKPRPKVLFEPGEVVRIKEGPFADFDGVVEDVNYDKNRLRVSVLIFGRATPVELEFGQVEKE